MSKTLSRAAIPSNALESGQTELKRFSHYILLISRVYWDNCSASQFVLCDDCLIYYVNFKQLSNSNIFSNTNLCQCIAEILKNLIFRHRNLTTKSLTKFYVTFGVWNQILVYTTPPLLYLYINIFGSTYLFLPSRELIALIRLACFLPSKSSCKMHNQYIYFNVI